MVGVTLLELQLSNMTVLNVYKPLLKSLCPKKEITQPFVPGNPLQCFLQMAQ